MLYLIAKQRETLKYLPTKYHRLFGDDQRRFANKMMDTLS